MMHMAFSLDNPHFIGLSVIGLFIVVLSFGGSCVLVDFFYGLSMLAIMYSINVFFFMHQRKYLLETLHLFVNSKELLGGDTLLRSLSLQ